MSASDHERSRCSGDLPEHPAHAEGAKTTVETSCSGSTSEPLETSVHSGSGEGVDSADHHSAEEEDVEIEDDIQDVTVLKAMKIGQKSEFTKLRRRALVVVLTKDMDSSELEKETSRLSESYDRAMSTIGDLLGHFTVVVMTLRTVRRRLAKWRCWRNNSLTPWPS
eukprot:scpid19432/ scgid29675/ 